MAHCRSTKRQGFTLIELLVVLAIIAVVAALILVGVQKARVSASKASTVNNLRQLGVAFSSYLTVQSQFPTEAGTGSSSSGGSSGGSGTTGGGTTPAPVPIYVPVAVPVVVVARPAGPGPVSIPTSTADSSTRSFYQALLPYVEQANANTTTPVGCYLDPGRRGVSVGAKRDFGYAASNATDSQGPSILDNPVGVRQADLRSPSNTYLLTSVWLDPRNYDGGDPTDLGWAQTLNSRLYGGTVKQDSDPTGSIQYLGGPYASTLPTLFADGHVELIPYSNYPNRWSFTSP
jgi:prepilin-type N-terminal cleavage/methylation domain-containing protein/prepilin-type processing-associated H-X9-DG protein